MKVRRVLSLSLWHVFAWWRGRQFRLLLLGLPALLCGLGVATLAAAAVVTPTQELEARYFDQANKALKAKDYAKALTCYDRIAYRSNDRPEILYGMAQAAEGLALAAVETNPDRANNLMNRARKLITGLAPLDRAGYGPAHFWAFEQIRKLPNLTLAQRDEARSHLRHALEARVENSTEVHANLGILCMMDLQLDEAEIHLQKASRSLPELRRHLAQIYYMRGDKQKSVNEAELAVIYFKERSRANPTDDFARLGWADAAALAERYDEALRILDDGFTRNQNDLNKQELYRLEGARLCSNWYGFLVRTSMADLEKRLMVLVTGLQKDPTNVMLLGYLMEATKLTGPEGDRAREAVIELAASGKAIGPAHFILGVDDLRQGKTNEAKGHFVQALELAPQMTGVANNLAWMTATTTEVDLPKTLGLVSIGLVKSPLAVSKPPDLPRALELAEIAKKGAPTNPNFCHTYGYILYKMGRYEDAKTPLEQALLLFDSQPDIHLWLAEIYERPGGDKDLALKHRQKAAAKTNEKKNKPAAKSAAQLPNP